MHGNILKQKLVHFTISAYRDYTKLNQRDFLAEAHQIDLKTKNIDDVDFFISEGSFVVSGTPGRTMDLMPIKHKSRSKAYFISDVDTWKSIRILPYFNKQNVFHTTNDKHLKRHYNRPLSEVQTTNTERTITLTDEFLSIRVNRFTKIRGINSRYFKKRSHIVGLKINIKTAKFSVQFMTLPNRIINQTVMVKTWINYSLKNLITMCSYQHYITLYAHYSKLVIIQIK